MLILTIIVTTTSAFNHFQAKKYHHELFHQFHDFIEYKGRHILYYPIISRAHSFLQKILPNSASQFAKFCSSLWPPITWRAAVVQLLAKYNK